jgi:hypothetical protein
MLYSIGTIADHCPAPRPLGSVFGKMANSSGRLYLLGERTGILRENKS